MTGAPVLIGTVTGGPIDGFDLVINAGAGRAVAMNVFVNDVQVGTYLPANTSFNNLARISVPVRIANGATVKIALATNSAFVAMTVYPIAYQLSVANDVTSIAALGSVASLTAMGATLTAANAWVPIGTLTANAKGIASVHMYHGNDTSRAGGNHIVDIGIGADGAETILVPNLLVVTSGTAVIFPETAPWRMPLPAGAKLHARMQTGADNINVQTALMY